MPCGLRILESVYRLLLKDPLNSYCGFYVLFFIVLDDEDPVVECPMDIVEDADPGENFATVTWYAPNVTDNSGESITPTLSHDSGSTFFQCKTLILLQYLNISGKQERRKYH